MQMIVIDDSIISDDIIKEKFCCDIKKCKGICCILGDAGAPLTDEEVNILEDIYDDIAPYLRPKAIKAIERTGMYEVDTDGEYVTTLVDGKECAYVIFDSGGIAKCAIEKAYLEGKINFRKPISCHLYPIRITKHKNYEAVNYHKWEVCHDARGLGLKEHIYLLDFLKEPLERKYGSQWFGALKTLIK